MNNKGFIATSLIYSFFLIFVTLFLGIIADYLQDKVLLNTIEKGIKEEINSSMGIGDFEVGDVLFFSKDLNLNGIRVTKDYKCTITSIQYKKSTSDDTINSKDIIKCNDDNEIDITDKRLEKALNDESNSITITGVVE